jgi:hypothetical protein
VKEKRTTINLASGLNQLNFWGKDALVGPQKFVRNLPVSGSAEIGE